MRRVRVLHISTAHPSHDPRIVFKQCSTLSGYYEVYCVLPHADPTAVPGVRFIRLPYFKRVIWRIGLTCPLILFRCLWLRPAIIHLYMPELIPFAYVFRALGARVIYEVQENLHKKMHLKTLNKGFLLERAFWWFDRLAQRHFYLIFTEHGYLSTYTRLAKPHAVIYNYPSLTFLELFRRPYQPKKTTPTFFYIGLLSFQRAFDTLIDAFAIVKTAHPHFAVDLFGRQTFTDTDLTQLPQFHAVRDHLRFYGYTDQATAFSTISEVTAGLALLKPVGDYPESYPTKLFEYMALGLPVVTSNFPLYRNVVEGHQCGLCVSPDNAQEIANALIYLIEHPEDARAMGQRGRLATEEVYNWEKESTKLLNFYDHILSEKQTK